MDCKDDILRLRRLIAEITPGWEKDLNGRVTTKEIMPVLFSVLEGSDQPAFRASQSMSAEWTRAPVFRIN
jgi:hypothetical protein